MKGLILKDFYISVKYLRSCFVMMAGFIAVSIFSEDLFFMAVYPSLVCGMVPQSLLSCDERSKWDSYCGTLPITKAEFVSGKYIIVLLLIALSLIVSGIGHGVKIIATGSMEWNPWLMILAFILILGCLGVAIQLPVMFRFGTEKGRIAYWLMVILVSGVSVPYGQDAGAELTISGFTAVYGNWVSIFTAVAMCCFAFSTIVGWGLYGARCAEFLLGSKILLPFNIAYALISIVGATVDLGIIWSISETFNGFMTVPNLIGVFLLAPVVVKLVRTYFEKETK